jgi:drug/metabolite transporter (DMT)-like permease
MMYDFVMPDMKNFWLLMVIGIFGGLGQITLTYSYRMAAAAEISIYNYSGIVFSIILGYVFLGEVLDITSIIGCTLVIVAAAITYFLSGERG